MGVEIYFHVYLNLVLEGEE